MSLTVVDGELNNLCDFSAECVRNAVLVIPALDRQTVRGNIH